MDTAGAAGFAVSHEEKGYKVGDVVRLGEPHHRPGDARPYESGIIAAILNHADESKARLCLYLFDGQGSLALDGKGLPITVDVAADITELLRAGPRSYTRRFARRQADGVVLFQPIDESQPTPMIHVDLLDISEGGAAIIVPDRIPVQVGDKVQLGMISPDNSQGFVVNAVVRACVPCEGPETGSPARRVSCQFLGVAPDSLRAFTNI